jgi:hypothetical protein
MKTRSVIIAAAGVALCVGVVIGQEGQQRRGQLDARQPTPDEMQEAWMATMNPADEHERLRPMIGEWSATTRFWMGEGEPMEGTGRARMEWVLGERFVRQNFTGNFMGMEFEGIGYTGFDRNKKKYVGSWMDNFSTSMMYDEGEWDQGSESVVYHGNFTDALGREIRGRSVVKVLGPDRMTYTMYHTEPGAQEKKVGEITYTRAGAGER